VAESYSFLQNRRNFFKNGESNLQRFGSPDLLLIKTKSDSNVHGNTSGTHVDLVTKEDWQPTIPKGTSDCQFSIFNYQFYIDNYLFSTSFLVITSPLLVISLAK
jgi:hypothetical protein